ncbi:hypothetical protein GCM10020229_83900 [Kitasatospora albolonga]
MGGQDPDQSPQVHLGRAQIPFRLPTGLKVFRHEAQVCQSDNPPTRFFALPLPAPEFAAESAAEPQVRRGEINRSDPLRHLPPPASVTRPLLVRANRHGGH